MSTLKAKQFHFIDDMDIAALIFAAVDRIEGFAGKVQKTIGTWIRRSNERRLLAVMNDRMLQDIGLSHYDVEKEVAKFFWQK